MKKKLELIMMTAIVVVLSSCGTYKRLGYLQDMQPDITYNMPDQPDAKIAKGDVLKISVFSSTPALAAPFNVSTGVYSIDPSAGSDIGSSVNNTSDNRYEVDKEGFITFPVFGKLKVEGMSMPQLKDYIENEIVTRKYIKDPVVQVSFDNFQFTMIGEAGSGIYDVPDGKVNIFEAFAMAGEPNESAVRNEICVIRTVDGNRRMYTIDLTSKDCYYSPVFYLQQNDMVYVKPKNNKFDDTISNRKDVFSTVVSAVSTVVNIFLWIKIYGL